MKRWRRRESEFMKRSFWQERWSANRIGFHLPTANVHLQCFGEEHLLSETRRVLVPLSGKSQDILWLHRHSKAEITAVEFVPEAVRAFYQENGLAHRVVACEGGSIYLGERLTTYTTDFFEFPKVWSEEAPRFDAVYDRAALTAMPADRRMDYAEVLLKLMAPGARLLLIVLEYDQSKMEGPPFSVSQERSRRFWGVWLTALSSGHRRLAQQRAFPKTRFDILAREGISPRERSLISPWVLNRFRPCLTQTQWKPFPLRQPSKLGTTPMAICTSEQEDNCFSFPRVRAP